MKFETRPFFLIVFISLVLCACFGAAILSPFDLGVGIKPPKMDEEANLADILAVMAGLLFATFAIRSILSPGSEIGQTLIDIGIFGLNILQMVAAGVLLIRVLRKRRQQKPAETTPSSS